MSRLVLVLGLLMALCTPAPASAAAPVISYTKTASASCAGHQYTLTAVFQYNPNTGRRRGVTGAFHGRDWTQVVHDFQIAASSSGGSVVTPSRVVDSIVGF